jgi:hypothetical protein
MDSAQRERVALLSNAEISDRIITFFIKCKGVLNDFDYVLQRIMPDIKRMGALESTLICNDTIEVPMRLTIKNTDAIKEFLDRHMQCGHDLACIKGPAPAGATYDDGEPIVRPVNVAWVCAQTGERVDIEYVE